MKKTWMWLALLSVFGWNGTFARGDSVNFSKLKGFNLLEKFQRNNKPFVEKDFQMIQELGFNFVRLPLDYRSWIKNNDWNQINEDTLKEIDQAVEWGKKYNIHVNINFHRAPGFCIAGDPEPKDLWTDPEAQAVCARHWAIFAKRYKGIPNSRLSFNLVNEPVRVDDNEVYYKVTKLLVEAIRKEDPDRLIIADGNMAGTAPVHELVSLDIMQSLHTYKPHEVTHFRAAWFHGSNDMAPPEWPAYKMTAHLYGPQREELHTPLIILGNFEKGSEVRIHVKETTAKVRLEVKADGTEILKKSFEPDQAGGVWKERLYRNLWNFYIGTYDKDYSAQLPSHAKKLEIKVTEGDWLTLSEIEIGSPDPQKKVKLVARLWDWGEVPAAIHLDETNQFDLSKNPGHLDRSWLKQHVIDPWKELEARGVQVHVGEFGCFNTAPHEVTLRWMSDALENFQEAGWGWCLWNFRGSFGILDSQRPDVVYEDFHGHKLDRKMLQLLQSH